MRTVRINAGGPSAYDLVGKLWGADRYFLGGNALVRSTGSTALPGGGCIPCSSERWGHFSYAIPVTEGKFRVNLKFCGYARSTNSSTVEVNTRVFDVYCNGMALLRDFDISKEAGGGCRAVSVAGLKPNAQGKLVLSFVPVTNYAAVNTIEVIDESP
jgi:hypothetical protein